MITTGGFFKLDIQIEGFTELPRAISGLDSAVSDFSPAWEAIEKDFYESEKGKFENEGSFEGLSGWKPLSKKYANWKASNFPGKPILERTGRLKESLTGNSSDSVLKKSTMEMEIGTSVPYGIYHQSRQARNSELPRRPFLDFSSAQRSRWVQIVKTELLKNINLKLAQQKPTDRTRIAGI